MKVSAVKAIAGYFNVEGDTGSLHPDRYGLSSKRPTKSFVEEIAALTPDEKRELAEGVVAITGDTLLGS